MLPYSPRAVHGLNLLNHVVILLSTIYHTGTHSAAEHFFGKDWMTERKKGQMLWMHCCQESLEIAKRPDQKTITMYRDPEKVIKSWAKRDLWKNPGYRQTRIDQWITQWDVWAELVPIAEVHSVSELPIKLSTFPDKNSFIPDGLLEYAQEKVNEVKQYLHFDLVTN